MSRGKIKGSASSRRKALRQLREVRAAFVDKSILQKRFENVRDMQQRSVGNTGVYTTPMPVALRATLLQQHRRIIEASVGAVAVIGENLGSESWRHKRCYLGLFINPARRGS